jgi:sugar phosphate permease
VILAAGTLAQASFATASIGLAAAAPALRDGYGLTLGQTGVVLAAINVGMLLTVLPWGYVADRFGERLVIAFGLAVAAVALVLCGKTTTYGALVAWLVVAGMFGASVNAASGRVVMGWFDEHERGFALGIRQTAIPIGGSVGALILPWLANAHGTSGVFYTLAVAAGVGAVVAAAFVREPRRHPSVEISADVRGPIRDVRMWRLAGGSSLYVIGQTALTSFCVLFLHEHRGMSTTAAAGVLAAMNIAGIATRILAGRWSDRLRERLVPLRIIGSALAVTMALVTVLVDAPLWILIPAIVAAGIISMSWNGLSFTATAELAGHARSGAALGFQQTLLGVSTAIFTPAFAWVVDAASWRAAFALSTLAPLLGLFALRRVPEPIEGVRTPGTSAIPPATP